MSFAVDHDRAGYRRWRITRRGHECHRVKKTWTVIRHARDRAGLASALAAGALVIAMLEPTLVARPVTGTCCALRRAPRGDPARRPTEPLTAIAGPAYAEHGLAQRTPLEAKLLVHRHLPQ
jgi:hypothetical protein